jgi:hypothetical protein
MGDRTGGGMSWSTVAPKIDVPEGWCLVPIEADSFLSQKLMAMVFNSKSFSMQGNMVEIYKAMIAAAGPV